MTAKPWSVSAHAVDIWTTPAWEKRAKLADAEFCVTCTATGRDHLASLAPSADQVELHYHGLDLTRFPPAPERAAGHDGSSEARAVEVLAVGRAVEKKGFEVLLEALAAIPPGLHWRLTHIGGGERLAALRARADALGITQRICWLGPKPQTEVLAAYRESDLFVLPCRIAANGDRDGLPNVLIEAQSQGLVVVSTNTSAIPELVRDGVTGRLVAADDVPALGAAIIELARDPDLRGRMGVAGEQRVRDAFALDDTIMGLARRFGLAESRGGVEKTPCVSHSTHR
jgi:glycosyltransferase involved in cell wall biosynthesis